MNSQQPYASNEVEFHLNARKVWQMQVKATGTTTLPESCKLNPRCWHLANCHIGSQGGYFYDLHLYPSHFAWLIRNQVWRTSPLCYQILPKWLKQSHQLQNLNWHSTLWTLLVQPLYHKHHEYVCLWSILTCEKNKYILLDRKPSFLFFPTVTLGRASKQSVTSRIVTMCILYL